MHLSCTPSCTCMCMSANGIKVMYHVPVDVLFYICKGLLLRLLRQMGI